MINQPKRAEKFVCEVESLLRTAMRQDPKILFFNVTHTHVFGDPDKHGVSTLLDVYEFRIAIRERGWPCEVGTQTIVDPVHLDLRKETPEQLASEFSEGFLEAVRALADEHREQLSNGEVVH